MWAKLTRGNKLMGPAGALGAMCFFLPWVLVSCEGQPVASFTGIQLAAGGQVGAQQLRSSPELFLVLLAALGGIVLVFLVYRGRLAVRRAAIVALAMAVASLLLLFVKFAAAPLQTAQMGGTIKLQLLYGYWGSVLANLAMLTGAVLDLRRAPMRGAPPIPSLPDETVTCPACGHAQPPANFCLTCGTMLGARQQ